MNEWRSVSSRSKDHKRISSSLFCCHYQGGHNDHHHLFISSSSSSLWSKEKQLPLVTTSSSYSSLQCGSLLQWFTNTKSLRQGKQLHAYMISSGILLHNTYINTKLCALYALCGSMTEARLVFDEITLKNSFLWNCMIRGYASSCDSGSGFSSLILYREMFNFGQKPDNFTYPFVLKACGHLSLVEIGKRVHCEIVISGFEADTYVANSLLAMYSRFGHMEIARKLFDTTMLPLSLGRAAAADLTSWNTLISGYVKNHDPTEAVNLFHSMQRNKFPRIKPDCTTLLSLIPACAKLGALKQGKEIHGFIVRSSNIHHHRLVMINNSLIDMYFNCNFIPGANHLFQNMMIRRDTVTWNSMVLGHARSGDAFQSLRLFCRMISMDGAGAGGGHPDQVTFISVLGACGQVSALHFGTCVHSLLFQRGFIEYTIVGTALIDMYAKCASVDCSYRIFNEMPEKNLFSWSAMVGGFGVHGRGREAIAVFSEMKVQGIKPDEVTFTTLLSACSHAGLVDEGRMIFDQMVKDYALMPTLEHCCCMVDLLGRAGHLDEAYEFIKHMKINPNFDVWTTLLSACRGRGRHNVKLAQVAARNAFYLDPTRVGSYVLLSNIYALEKKWGDVERVRLRVRQMGLKKSPGCSFIELDKVVHRFLVGDRAHPQSQEIYAKLEELRQQLKQAGYTPDTSSVLYAVEEDVKEKMLWDHSERLATAFALIHTSPGTVIRITKNLRVCGDCHVVIKFISKLTARQIIMRDSRRFHHFSNGFCSCGDYW